MATGCDVAGRAELHRHSSVMNPMNHGEPIRHIFNLLGRVPYEHSGRGMDRRQDLSTVRHYARIHDTYWAGIPVI